MIDGHRRDAHPSPEVGDNALADAAVPEAAKVENTEPESQGSAAAAFAGAVQAIGRRFVAIGVKADQVTVVGVLLAVATGAVIGLGLFYVAVVLLTAGGLMDTLDGAVAKASGSASKRGAFFDSVSDRVADMFIFGGLAWYFIGGPGHDPGLAIIPFAILGVSNTISYERAKAESLGYSAKGGLMERAERLIALGIALLAHVVLVPLIVALLALCLATAVQRFVKVWRQAGDPAVVTHMAAAGAQGVFGGVPGLKGLRPARVESRWRAWRDASSDPTRQRRRVAVASRARSRRREEPLSIRLRRAFESELAGARATTRLATRSARARTERRRQDGKPVGRHRAGDGH